MTLLVPPLGPEELAADTRLIQCGFRRLVLDTESGLTCWRIDLGMLHVRIIRTALGHATLELGITDADGVMWRPWSIDTPPHLVELSHEAVAFAGLIAT